jgi:hypothetical protein
VPILQGFSKTNLTPPVSTETYGENARPSPLSGAIAQLDRTTLERLRDGQFPESRTLDYKQGDPTKDLAEFTKDVTAFANTDGGHLLYGIAEDRATSAPADFPGFDVPEPEKVIRRLNDFLRGNVEPRLRDPEYQWIEVGEGKRVLVVRVARSWSAPHASRRSLPFYKRSSNASPPMDVNELRNAFQASGQAEQRFRAFCDERVSLLLSGLFPGSPSGGTEKLLDGLTSIVHIAPLASLVGPYRLDVAPNLGPLGKLVPGRNYDGASPARYPNVDGYLSFMRGGPAHRILSFMQAFRNATLEGACIWEPSALPSGEVAINAPWLEKTVINDVTTAIELFKALDLGPPFFFRHTIIRGRGYYLQPRNGPTYGSPIARDILSFPDLAGEDWPTDVGAFLRPSFDAFWNVFGLERSENYDEQGRWFDPDAPRP